MQCLMPETTEELAAALSQLTDSSKLLAGGTDYVIQARRGKYDPDILVYLGRIPALREVRLTDTELRIGAMATMREVSEALEAVLSLRALADAASDVGSPQIRSKATVAGNLCNASPAGDMLPVCRLYDARLEVLEPDGTAGLLPVDRLILGPRRNALGPRQAVTAVVIDRRPLRGCVGAFRKIGSRERVSISREGLAALVRLEADGTVAEARFTLGAVAPTPLRIPEAEALSVGRRLADPELLSAVTKIVAQTVHDNCRPANRLYKTEAARGLTADVFMKLLERASPLPE